MGVATEVTGLTDRQIRHLHQRGLVLPTIGAPSGKGTVARYAFYDLMVLGVLARLRMTADGSRAPGRAINEMEKLRAGGWTQHLLVTGDWQSFWLEQDRGELLGRLDHDALLVTVDLGRLDAQLRTNLERFGIGAPADPQRQAPPDAVAAA